MTNHEYKRLNQRFDARLSRIKRLYKNVESKPLFPQNSEQMHGFVTVFYNNPINKKSITSFELHHVSRKHFNTAITRE